MSKSTKINMSYYISSISLTHLNGEKIEITSKEEFDDFVNLNDSDDFDVCLDFLNRIVYLYSDETEEYEERGNIVLGDENNYAFELQYLINTKEKERNKNKDKPFVIEMNKQKDFLYSTQHWIINKIYGD